MSENNNCGYLKKTMSNVQAVPSRRQFLKTVATVATFLSFKTGYAQKPLDLKKIRSRSKKPRNIIFILSDDHRYDFMGFMGKPSFLETPNMDRLAREGVHLQNTFVSTSLCSPSRASIFTGQYAHNHGVVDNISKVPEGTIFFPQYLHEIGYDTAFIGKWHMGEEVESDAPRPGFDRWISFPGLGHYFNPTLNIDGKKTEQEGYITDILTDYAIDWLKQDREKPFFLCLSHKAVHSLFKPAKRHLNKYAHVLLEYPKSMANTEENYKGKPAWIKAQRDTYHGLDFMYYGHIDFDTFYRRYCETLLGIDDSIGRVFDYLEESGSAETTLVLYMSDNGFSFGEHGLIDKRHMYEESIRMPLLIYCPEIIKPGLKISQMVQNIDIAPTILELAGLEAPEYMDGWSFLPLLQGKEISWRDVILYEYYWERNFPYTPTIHGIRTDRYKYIHYYGIWDTDEFYDLKSDPDEMHNLIDSPEHQKLVKEYNERMFELLKSTSGMQIPLRSDNPAIRWDRKHLKLITKE